MKFNFRKIASVLASVVMLGSTVGIAAAANYPAPFVSGSASNVAIVYGTGSGVSFTDALAAGDLQSNLQFELGKATASGGTSTSASASGIDSVEITKGSTKLNLNDGTAEIWGTSITKSDLKTTLADGKFYNKQNTEYKYTQTIDLGNLTFTHFSDSDYLNRVPTLGFQIPSNTYVANYTLDFVTDPEATPAADLTDFENKNINILGKSYFILDFKNVTDTAKITLLDSAVSTSLVEGESKTVSASGKDRVVSISFITSDEVILTIDGENTDKLSATGTTYGNTYKLSDGTYVGIKSINVQNYAGGSKSVEFSLGQGKLELTTGSTVKINDKTVTDLIPYIYLGQSSTKQTWQKLAIKWTVDNEAFLTPGKELIMPGFGAVKLSMANITMPSQEVTEVTTANDVAELKTTLKSGVVTIPLLWVNNSAIGNFTGIGKSPTQRLATTNSSRLWFNTTSAATYQNEGFIASWASTKDAESYYLKATISRDVGVANRTDIIDKITGDTVCANLENAQTCTIGNVVLTTSSTTYYSAGERGVNLSINSGGSFNKLYTKSGMLVYLPYSETRAAEGFKGSINLTYSAANNFTLQFFEADKDGTLEKVSFNMTLIPQGTTTRYVTVSDVIGDNTPAETPTSGSKIWESYVLSELATKILHDKSNTNQDSAKVEYHGGQVYANLFVASPDSIVSGGGTTTVGGSVSDLGNVLVKDNEISSVSTKNLIVVGGSCINSVAAKILGSDTPLCGADFTAKAGVGANQALIKVITSPYAADKVAMLVAGYEAADTTKAAKYVSTEKPATDKDTSKKLSTSSTVATVVV